MVALVLCVGFVVYGAVAGARWFVLAPGVVGGLVTLVAVVVNRRHGVAFEGGRVVVWSGKRRVEHAIGEVAGIGVKDWTDSSDWVMKLRDGSVIELPAAALPPRHMIEKLCREAGVRLED